MLFDTIEKVCSNYNSIGQSNEIQIILSNIFNTLRQARSNHIVAINMAIIDLISKLLLSDHIKGIYYIFNIKFFIYLVSNSFFFL